MACPREHLADLHSTNPIERLHGEIERQTEVVGIIPNEADITRFIGAILMDQSAARGATNLIPAKGIVSGLAIRLGYCDAWPAGGLDYRGGPMRAVAIGAAIFLALSCASKQTAFAQDAPPDSQIDPAISELFPDMPRMNKLLNALITDRKAEKTDPADSGAPEAKIDKDFSGPGEVYGEAERQAAFLEVKRQGQAAINARNDEYFREFAAIRAEDASALKFLSTQCTNNDDPSGDCMNDVSRARKVDQRMQVLLAKEGAADFLAKKVKTAWRPESPIRAAAVKMPTESNTGLQAARDYVAKHSFRDSTGGFLGCHAKRAAVAAARGDDMRPANGIDEYATFLWDQNSLVRDLAAIETSGAQDTPVNAYRICVLRARWAELEMQKQSAPPLAKLADPSAGIALTKPEVLTRTGTASGKALIESGIERLGAWDADRGPREARERAERAEMQRKIAEANRQYAAWEAKRAADEERNRQRAANGDGFDFGGLLLGVAQGYLNVKQAQQEARQQVRSYTPPPSYSSPAGNAAATAPTSVSARQAATVEKKSIRCHPSLIQSCRVNFGPGVETAKLTTEGCHLSETDRRQGIMCFGN